MPTSLVLIDDFIEDLNKDLKRQLSPRNQEIHWGGPAGRKASIYIRHPEFQLFEVSVFEELPGLYEVRSSVKSESQQRATDLETHEVTKQELDKDLEGRASDIARDIASRAMSHKKSSSRDFRSSLIKLGEDHPELRDDLRPILDKISLKNKRVPKKHVKEKFIEGLKNVGPGTEGMGRLKIERGPNTTHDGKKADYFLITLRHSDDFYDHFLESVRNKDDYDYEARAERMRKQVGDFVARKWYGKSVVTDEKPRVSGWELVLPRD